MEGITEQELIEALQKAVIDNPDGSPGGLTMAELAEACQHSENWVRVRLLRLKKAGNLRVVNVVRENLAGINQRVTAYRLMK